MKRFLFVAAFAGLVAFPAVASARTERHIGWRFNQVWTTSVRLLRVDLKCSILEKDKDTGYLLFDCPNGSKSSGGSMELVRGGEGALPWLKVSLHMDAMPSYVESHFLDKLEKKLKADYGDPVAIAPLAGASGKSSSAGGSAAGKSEAALEGSVNDEEDVEVNEKDLEDANEEK